MPAKKTATVKTSARQKRPIGLTSALGPKGTTMIVIAGVAVIAIAAALATAGNGAASPNNNPATSTTSTTP